jgi:beta-fructofuranosidase
MMISRTDLKPGTLASREGLVVLVRRVGDDPALAEWDRRQNYARYAGHDGLVLECVVATAPPRIAKDGRLRLGVPVAVLGDAPQLDIAVRLGGPHLALIVNGVVVDEEWPAGPAVVPMNDAPGELPALPPLTQYWAPPGHNAWAGDVMLTAAGDRLHLFWLTDRRMHGSKFGCGGCSFAHASTTDLTHWEHHPLAYPVTEYWEAANGTGCCVVQDGVFHLYANVLTERLKLEQEHPNGPHLATSTDGIHFTKQGRAHGLPGEPGMIRDEHDRWHAIAVSKHADGVWRSSRYESDDLRNWRLADLNFLPEPGWPTSRTVFSSECFNWFRWRDWYYIIGGRTGFWRARQLLGPYQRPAQDIYDGLMVPQVAVWNDRAILGGWLPLNDKDWGGHLVFRELRQCADGGLEMFRLRELPLPAGARQYRQEFAPDEIRDLAGPNLEYDFTAPVAAEVVAHYDFKSNSTIFDLGLSGQRTLIFRRPGRVAS